MKQKLTFTRQHRKVLAGILAKHRTISAPCIMEQTAIDRLIIDLARYFVQHERGFSVRGWTDLCRTTLVMGWLPVALQREAEARRSRAETIGNKS